MIHGHYRRTWQAWIVYWPQSIIGKIWNTGTAGRGQHQAALLYITGKTWFIGIVDDMVVFGIAAAKDIDFAIGTELAGKKRYSYWIYKTIPGCDSGLGSTDISVFGCTTHQSFPFACFTAFNSPDASESIIMGVFFSNTNFLFAEVLMTLYSSLST